MHRFLPIGILLLEQRHESEAVSVSRWKAVAVLGSVNPNTLFQWFHNAFTPADERNTLV